MELTTLERSGHRQAIRMSISDIARYLQDILGQRLTAIIAGVGDAKAVGKWARGERVPHPETDTRLRHAYQVVQFLLQSESAETVRAWFTGMNPELEDRAPALVLAQDPMLVMQAARAFVAHG